MTTDATTPPAADPLTDDALTAIRQRAERATPGLYAYWSPMRGGAGVDAHFGFGVNRGNSINVLEGYPVGESGLTKDDVMLFGSAKSYVDALLGEVDRLRHEVRVLRERERRLAGCNHNPLCRP